MNISFTFTRLQKPTGNKTVLLQTSPCYRAFYNISTLWKCLLREIIYQLQKVFLQSTWVYVPDYATDMRLIFQHLQTVLHSLHILPHHLQAKEKKKCELELLWNNLKTILQINNALALPIPMMAIEAASIVHWHHLNKVFLAWHLNHAFQAIKSCLKHKCS